MLAAKASLCVRVDALGEEPTSNIGLSSRAMVEQRLQQYEDVDKVGSNTLQSLGWWKGMEWWNGIHPPIHGTAHG
jgi:hypothetical protein